MVIHSQIQFWKKDKLPPQHDILLLVKQVLKVQKQLGPSGKVLVHCLDGCTRSGLFLAIFVLLQRVEATGNINIPWGILTIRETQGLFVNDIDQLKFCRDVVQNYLENK